MIRSRANPSTRDSRVLPPTLTADALSDDTACPGKSSEYRPPRRVNSDRRLVLVEIGIEIAIGIERIDKRFNNNPDPEVSPVRQRSPP
jgi:hypothetical protein